MFTINGKYASAIVYTDIADQSSISQVMELCNQKISKGQKIRMMPDIHAGAGCTIGTTMTLGDKVIPNLVGVDIGCGMEVIILQEKDVDLKMLDDIIHRYIPAGFTIREISHQLAKKAKLYDLRCFESIDINRAEKSIGTLGGGNHFIELDKDDDDTLYLVIHSGSRHLGVEIATHYQDLAYKQLSSCSKEDIHTLIENLKSEGRQMEIEHELMKFKESKLHKIPKSLAYVEGPAYDDYIHDMHIAQQYAVLNRKAIADTIIEKTGLHATDRFQTIHNYIDLDNMILRKGAVSAQKGERLIIPINMRDGSLICIGKGNSEWNYSAPHGAGRLLSRSAAKEKFSVEQFKNQMEGIYTTSVGYDTIDESPMAYKPMSSIINNIGDTVYIEKIIRPVYNFKAGEK